MTPARRSDDADLARAAQETVYAYRALETDDSDAAALRLAVAVDALADALAAVDQPRQQAGQ